MADQLTQTFYKHIGTAGVWRIQAIKDAGGWKDRTTVEDMDLAVRASLQGWEFVFVGDVTVSYPYLTIPLIHYCVLSFYSPSTTSSPMRADFIAY